MAKKICTAVMKGAATAGVVAIWGHLKILPFDLQCGIVWHVPSKITHVHG